MGLQCFLLTSTGNSGGLHTAELEYVDSTASGSWYSSKPPISNSHFLCSWILFLNIWCSLLFGWQDAALSRIVSVVENPLHASTKSLSAGLEDVAAMQVKQNWGLVALGTTFYVQILWLNGKESISPHWFFFSHFYENVCKHAPKMCQLLCFENGNYIFQ